jgi:hypothetical protein
MMGNHLRFGRITETRTGCREGETGGELARWGAKPGEPVCGLKWLEQYRTEPAQLSNGLATDRQWYAFSFSSLLIKGFCELKPVEEALAGEGVFPVVAELTDGRRLAMATLWFNIIKDSVCGAYHEIVLSIDVARSGPGRVAVRTSPTLAPWAVQYASFGSPVCDGQFLHSLWINSPLSIMWGREMQAFPKHPVPVSSELVDEPDRFRFDIGWDNDVIMQGSVAKRFGTRGLMRQSLGLLRTQNWGRVVRFLAAASFDVPIIMPSKTAAQSRTPRDYVGHLWKGPSPWAVQVWPWDCADSFAIGPARKATGCEDHNGHQLLCVSAFEPVAVTCLSRAAALVESPASVLTQSLSS